MCHIHQAGDHYALGHAAGMEDQGSCYLLLDSDDANTPAHVADKRCALKCQPLRYLF